MFVLLGLTAASAAVLPHLLSPIPTPASLPAASLQRGWRYAVSAMHGLWGRARPAASRGGARLSRDGALRSSQRDRNPRPSTSSG